MRKNLLIVMCGLPASGKSTYKQWLIGSGVFFQVCPDLIRKELYGDENIQGNGKKVFEIAYSQLKSLGESKEDVIFDATNINADRRKKLIKEMRPYFDVIICKWFDTPLYLCKERNTQRERQVPNEVIERMLLNFQEPTMEEGWDYIERIISYY